MSREEHLTRIMSFSDKVVIVTGASSGIGASTALLFGKEGADVVIVGRNETRLNNVAEQISKFGKKPLIINADVTKDEDAKKIIQMTVEKHGKIDVLINNAGIVKYTNVDDEKLIETYDSIFNTNLRSAVLMTSLAVYYLKKTKGNIVNVSSVGGKNTLGDFGFGAACYCASKAAMDQFSRNCAMELAEFGVRVNTVSPGPVRTNILGAAGMDNIDFEESARKHTALGILTEPEEVAALIAFLASKKTRSVTGSDYLIDAGVTVHCRRN